MGLREDGLPDIDWVEIPASEFIYQDSERLTLPTFHISRYPVTYRQFQAFIDADDGFHNPVWWDGLAASDKHKAAPDEQYFKFWNHPRDDVSWYDAMAFCRWLSAKLGQLDPIPDQNVQATLAEFTAATIAKAIDAAPNLKFTGIQAYQFMFWCVAGVVSVSAILSSQLKL